MLNRIGGVLVSALGMSEVERGFKPRSSQTKDYTIERSFKEKQQKLTGSESG